MPGNYSVQRPVGIVHGPWPSLQRRKRRILITFLGKRKVKLGMRLQKRGLNDAKVVAFGASKVYLRKKLQNWRPVVVSLPHSHSLSLTVSLIYAASLGCASTGRNSCNSLSLSPSLYVGVYLNKLKLVIWQRTEKRKLRTFSVN